MDKRRIGTLAVLALAVVGLIGGWLIAHEETLTLTAPQAAITVDGDVTDWADVPGLSLELTPAFPPGFRDKVDAELKVAYDEENIYVLFAVQDDYNFNLENHKFSPAIAVQFPIDEEAGVYMGAASRDSLSTSTGMVDIWHWELDCVAGELSGGVDRTEDGNDPACNLDDEYATTAFAREDDGKGDTDNPDANNLLRGVWTHSNPVADGEGTWHFEMARPLQTGDSQDAQFEIGGLTHIALAYWDADESAEGWTDTGHLQTSDLGWIEVALGE
jgi:DMSO reductase family type II enzyme heme b subunit